MSKLNVKIESLRAEIYKLIETEGIQSESVLKKSQEINKLIILSHIQGDIKGGEILC